MNLATPPDYNNLQSLGIDANYNINPSTLVKVKAYYQIYTVMENQTGDQK